MKIDIFEDMKKCVGCDNISDLPYRKRVVWEIIKQHSPLDYPKEQLEKFSHYVFSVDYAVIMGILEMKEVTRLARNENLFVKQYKTLP